jgi:hypothetical protein
MKDPYQLKIVHMLRAIIRMELSILPGLTGRRETELRTLIWRANDLLAEIEKQGER